MNNGEKSRLSSPISLHGNSSRLRALIIAGLGLHIAINKISLALKQFLKKEMGRGNIHEHRKSTVCSPHRSPRHVDPKRSITHFSRLDNGWDRCLVLECNRWKPHGLVFIDLAGGYPDSFHRLVSSVSCRKESTW